MSKSNNNNNSNINVLIIKLLLLLLLLFTCSIKYPEIYNIYVNQSCESPVQYWEHGWILGSRLLSVKHRAAFRGVASSSIYHSEECLEHNRKWV